MLFFLACLGFEPLTIDVGLAWFGVFYQHPVVAVVSDIDHFELPP